MNSKTLQWCLCCSITCWRVLCTCIPTFVW